MTNQPHIIVCDDEADLREMRAEYLGKRGFRVTEAAEGAALRTVLAEVSPDLILLDINMPGRMACRSCAACMLRQKSRRSSC